MTARIRLIETNKPVLREYIDNHIYGDKNKCSDLSDMLAHDLIKRQFGYLWQIVVGGKGWNDRSKEAVCDIIGLKRMYLMKEMKEIIAIHCDVPLAQIELHYALLSSKEKIAECQAVLEETFSNSSEVLSLVAKWTKNGFDQITKEGRKFYLVNAKTNEGVHLKELPLRKYVTAVLDRNGLEREYSTAFQLQQYHFKIGQQPINLKGQ